MEILAIGGGNKTPAINAALERTGHEKPSVLLLPSACSTPASYERKVPLLQEYFNKLGVDTSVLHEYGERPTEDKIAHELGAASLLYTIGGNSPYMLNVMRNHNTDQAVREAIEQGKVHAGTSAGALLPFELMHSCVEGKPSQNEWDYEMLQGLGILPGVVTAHANQHDPTPNGIRPDNRHEALLTHFPSVPRGYSIDNGAALFFSSSEPIVILSTPEARARIIERKDGQLTSRSAIPSDLQIRKI